LAGYCSTCKLTFVKFADPQLGLLLEAHASQVLPAAIAPRLPLLGSINLRDAHRDVHLAIGRVAASGQRVAV
jgi:hypothetical protein